MTSDSAIPNLKSNSAVDDTESISSLCDVEVKFTVADTEIKSVVAADTESTSILPEAEINSVLLYLKSNSVLTESESNSAVANVESDTVVDAELPVDLVDKEPPKSPPQENGVSKNIQVQMKTEEGRFLLILPTESQLSASERNWNEIWQQLKLRLNGSDRFTAPDTPVHLVAGDRLLDARQLQQLAETLSEVQMQLKSVATSRRQTAIAAAAAGYSVEQIQRENILASESKVSKKPSKEALYLEMTVRSGVEIRHPGSVIILGDVNPGGIVVADGDILVWGRLRGVAHAGARGNRECLIMALQMEPTQLRIADAVARAPEKLPMQFYPEVAYVTPQGIRIGRASDFSKTQFNRMNQEP
ncbi:septum site-determining protein MinC [Fischerella major NIES-592]|uniref:Probable septum site-determining protein MinC n=2 Tax=Fischerella TaxID=1190 RepID=A0A1U7GUY4_9CYAN|nr:MULTISPECIES: septum site-determining protein MinC [Fischerella]OKH11852.1 septum site-determining protein MinC [Fischerella major NIES-592]PMB42946.1 septum site-determining protein MinC [Fischerella thermalis CCMEE 5330]BAU08803.1 septum formation inhibitor MinC [Fischerella sp. NIES-3754]